MDTACTFQIRAFVSKSQESVDKFPNFVDYFELVENVKKALSEKKSANENFSCSCEIWRVGTATFQSKKSLFLSDIKIGRPFDKKPKISDFFGGGDPF